jgi:alanine-glyoxylate transaminase / serine-glyoxylate transaminase / serine-pyruvate transaminase
MEAPEITVSPRILMGPGPSMADPRVLKAMSTGLIGHLDPEFLQLMDQTQKLLRYVFETENPLTIPISGTGSAAMEAAICNLVEPGDTMLVCCNGYFGLRMQDMAERYGAQVTRIDRPWGQVFDPSEIEEALKEKSYKLVGIVHAETSTGARQPLEDIVRIVHDHGALLIVDAVTSLGGLSVGVDRLGIDACYSGGQKCLSVPPGASPLTFGDRAVEKLVNRKTKVPNWYLDLTTIQKYWGGERTYHHTAPISSIYALYEGLRIIAEEGLEKRWARHQENVEYLWQEMESLGFRMLVEQPYRLPSLTTVVVPEALDEAAVRKQLLNDYNIEVGGGLGELKGRVWRVGLMGYTSRKENVNALTSALRSIMLKE